MKKILLLILSAGLFLVGINAQNPCPTCHQGTKGTMVNTLLASSANRTVRPPNGNSSLGQSYIVQNVCGLNYVTASILTETRSAAASFNSNGTGFPSIDTLKGLPSCNTIVQAYLYWEASYTEASPPATTATVTNPLLATATYPGTMIGQAGPKCWGETGSASYRADITAAIAGNGNYTINLNGFANAAWEVDGMTMVVVYTSPAAYSGSLSLWDGDIVNWYVLPAQTFSGFTACAASTGGSAFGAFGDCQINVNGGINTDNFNGSIATFNNIFWNCNIIPTNVTAGQTTTSYAPYTNNGGDCFSWTVAGLYWQNTTCIVCSGSAVTLTTSFTNPTCGNNNGTANVTAIGGSFPYTYLWMPGGQTTASITGLSIGTYTVRVISGCDTSKAIDTLTGVSLLLTKNQGNVKCNGGSNGFAVIHAGGGVPPYTYLWVPTGSTNDSIFNLTAGSYTVTVTDNNGCHTNDTIIITQPLALAPSTSSVGVSCNGGNNGIAMGSCTGGTKPYTYKWNTGGTGDTARNMTAGTYTMTVTDSNNCSATASIIVTQPAGMTVVATGPQTICIGQTGTLKAIVSGGTQPYTYLWSTGSTADSALISPIATSTYTVTVTDANGCSKSTTILVTLGPALTVTTQGGSMCAGSSATICATVGGGTGGNIFTWQPGNLSGPCVSVSPTASAVYTVTVLDNCGSSVTATASVLVNPLPDVLFAADLYQGCYPLCIQFRDLTTLTSGKILSWTWKFGNGDSSNKENPIYCYPNSGLYTVDLTVVSDSGCSSTLKILNMITVYTHPIASFSASPQPASILDPTIQFTDKSTDQYGIVFWTWKFGDGIGTSNIENPSYTYSDTGTYCPQLIVMNIHGCTDTVTDCLVVDPDYCLYIPSAFTPNDNGRNDVFKPKGQYIKKFEMYIFDRWGMELFHTTDIENGWNGTVKGGSLVSQEDTYVYKILVTDSRNKNHSYIGAVSLLK